MKKFLKAGISVFLAMILSTSVIVMPVSASTNSPDYVEIKSYFRGDVNKDGKITNADSLLIQRYTIKAQNFNKDQLRIADVNMDNKVDNKDALAINRYVISCASEYIPGLIYFVYKFDYLEGAQKVKLSNLPKLKGSGDKISYSSNNTNIVSSQSNGNVSVNASGDAIITAKTSVSKQVYKYQFYATDYFNKLAFSFCNCKEIRGSYDGKEIDKKFYDYIYDNTSTSKLLNQKNKLGGLCWGMSMATCLFNCNSASYGDSGIKISDFGRDSIDQLQVTDKYTGNLKTSKNSSLNGLTLLELLITLHMSQKCEVFRQAKERDIPIIKKGEVDYYRQLIDAVKDVKYTGTPVMLGYGGPHVVVGYKVEEKNLTTKVYYYDPNDPKGNNAYITFYTDSRTKKVTKHECTLIYSRKDKNGNNIKYKYTYCNSIDLIPPYQRYRCTNEPDKEIYQDKPGDDWTHKWEIINPNDPIRYSTSEDYLTVWQNRGNNVYVKG